MSAADILTLHAEGRLLRDQWSDTDQHGRQRLCLYTALAGNPDARPETCPAELAPQWIAHLLPWIDSAGSLAEWDGVVRRVAALAPHLSRVTPECEWRVRALCVREALSHVTTDEWGVRDACERVIDLCDQRGRGESVEDGELSAARAAWAAAADDAWADAADAAADAAWAAAADAAASDAADAAASDAADAAADAAASAAADAAARAAADAAAWDAARDAARSAAWAAAWAARDAAWAAADRLIDAVLSEIEADLSAQGVAS